MLACACAFLAPLASGAGPAGADTGVDARQPELPASRSLAQFSLEELRNVVVVSVSRRPQSLLEAPSSVYVIPGEEVRRMGITTLPEALRLAPTLEVAALDAHQYAISARGFNSNIANKMLVMVDGRTIYSPLFSGVFWDAQDFVPADIERIEVVTGPAGVAWGTNAVNGVVDVVTKPASETQGVSLSTTSGSDERSAVARYGWRLGPSATARVHARTFHRDATLLRSGGNFHDAMRGTTAGFRTDWLQGDSSWRLSGGVYDAETDARPLYGPVRASGAHLLARWLRRVGDATELDVRSYVDHAVREDRFLLQDDATLFDVDAKLRHRIGSHRWLLGLGYRHGRDSVEPGLVFAFLPPERSQSWSSAFVQDEIALSSALALTLGLRFERNPYTGWESLPSVRLGWTLANRGLLWGSLSRAVRSPARLDREIFTPPQPPFIVAGGPNFRVRQQRSDRSEQPRQRPALAMVAAFRAHARRAAGPAGRAAPRRCAAATARAAVHRRRPAIELEPASRTAAVARGAKRLRRAPRRVRFGNLHRRDPAQRPRLADLADPVNEARRCAAHERRRAFCLLCAALPLSATKVRAVEAALEQVKAAYLLKFPGFVEWPPDAFEQARSPFVFAVAGAEDVYATLHELATANPVQGRPTRVLRLGRPEPSTPTHLLFVGNDLSGQLSGWVGAYARKPVVVVAETANGLERGAALNFVEVGDRLRFEASPRAAERVGIRFSSRLLGVAERVLEGDAS